MTQKNKKKIYYGIGLIMLLAILIVGVHWYRNAHQDQVTRDAYNSLVRMYSPSKNMKNVQQAQKRSERGLSATLIYRPNCERCRGLVDKLNTEISGHNNGDYIPFNVVDGNQKEIKSLMAQLNTKQTPMLIVWSKEKPVFVYIADNTKQSAEDIQMLLHGKNIDNHNESLESRDGTSYYYHNAVENVLSQNETVPLRGFLNGDAQ